MFAFAKPDISRQIPSKLVKSPHEFLKKAGSCRIGVLVNRGSQHLSISQGMFSPVGPQRGVAWDNLTMLLWPMKYRPESMQRALDANCQELPGKHHIRARLLRRTLTQRQQRQAGLLKLPRCAVTLRAFQRDTLLEQRNLMLQSRLAPRERHHRTSRRLFLHQGQQQAKVLEMLLQIGQALLIILDRSSNLVPVRITLLHQALELSNLERLVFSHRLE